MTSEPNSDSPLELAHVLFTDIVGYSKLLGNQQRELFQRLNGIVCWYAPVSKRGRSRQTSALANRRRYGARLFYDSGRAGSLCM